MKQPKFITFYSFKGGVGRSLALANVAYLLWREGRKVLIMDFDLEAPGQHATDLFHLDRYDSGPGKGVVELITEYLDFRTRKRKGQVGESESFDIDLRSYIRSSGILREKYALNPELYGGSKEESREALYLMPAGQFGTDEYDERLARLDWEHLYNEEYGSLFLGSLMDEIGKMDFDYVLIDSRTGLSDECYVTALDLADVIVMVSGFNRQNIQGTRDVVKKIKAKRIPMPPIALVASPSPAGQVSQAVAQRKVEIRKEWPEFSRFSVEIPYQADLALREKILVWNSDLLNESDDYTRRMKELKAILKDTSLIDSFNKEKEKLIVSNPFSLIRRDYIEDKDVVRYFVDPGEVVLKEMNNFMPLVIRGARGSGKTMLATRFGLDAWLAEKQIDGDEKELPEQIGLYFKIDADFLHTFNQRDKELQKDFDLLFAQFFDIVVIRKALDRLNLLGGLEIWCEINSLFETLYWEFGEEAPDEIDLEVFSKFLEKQIRNIRLYLNNPGRVSKPFFIQPNVLMKLLLEHLRKRQAFKGRYLVVLVDEYENFADYQQRIVNTRVKQSRKEDGVTYRLFMRSGGLRTRETLAREQTIEATNDYREYCLDDWTMSEFRKHALDVAKKHLELNSYFNSHGYTELGSLLTDLSAEEEARLLLRSRKTVLTQWVKKYYADYQGEILAWFKEEDSPLRQATALVILNQGKPVKDVIEAFRGDRPRSRDWYHNYHRGTLHWLCRLCHKDKCYSGLDTLVSLSGRNIRVFLDLCHGIFSHWEAAGCPELPITAQIQDQAIREKAKANRDNLRSVDRSVNEINHLVERMGRLFEAANKSPRQSEPEINHFAIKAWPEDRRDEDRLRKLLRDAQYVNLLQMRRGSKQKSLSDPRHDEWIFAPWLTPLFNVSARRKKRLEIDGQQLLSLFEADDEESKVLLREFERKFDKLGIPPEEETDTEADEDDRQHSLL